MRKLTLVVLCVLVIPVVAAADLVIKEKISSSGFMGMGGSEGIEVTYLKGDMIRTEAEMTYTGMMTGMVQGMKPKGPEKTITIMDITKGIVWHLDEEQKTYTEVSFRSEMGGDVDEDPDFEIKDTKLTKTGKKREIAGYGCEGVNVEMTMEVGPKGQRMTTTTDILFWMAPEKKELVEMRTMWQRMLESMGTGDESFGFKDAMNDLSKIMEDLKGIPLGMDISMNMPMGEGGSQEAEMNEAMKMMQQYMKGDKAGEEAEDDGGAPSNRITIKREAISVSEEKLDDSLFTTKGYTKRTTKFGPE
ncbi:MAG: hypothetical protein ABIJ00_08720 [Candidatus Eisenbacteria bacterium]